MPVGTVTGYAVGLVHGLSLGITPMGYRFELFRFPSPDAALDALVEAYGDVLEEPPPVKGFDRKGRLIVERRRLGRPRIDRSVTVFQGKKQTLLSLEVFDNRMRPLAQNYLVAERLLGADDG